MGKKKRSRDRRILWIEDEVFSVNALAHLLEKHGLSVDLVEDSRTACHCLERHRYDLIILDCMLPPASKTEMPIESGITFMKQLRRGKIGDGSHKSVPVIVITAVADTNILRRLQKQKITKLLRKPMTFDEIYCNILEVLAGD